MGDKASAMFLIVRQWIALRGIFRPASSPCRSSYDLEMYTRKLVAFLREREGSLTLHSHDGVCQACSEQWSHFIKTLKV